MKRILSIILACLMLFTFSGCSQTINDNISDSDVGTETVTEEPRKSEFPDNTYSDIPDGYVGLLAECPEPGTVIEFSYEAATESGEIYQKTALVSLPYGYDENDKEAKYDVLYLMHGGGDDQYWYFTGAGKMSGTKKLLDNMVTKGDIKPCIVVAPTYDIPVESVTDGTAAFHYELTEYLIPAFESQYNTYLEEATPEGIKASRRHRAFGGFSMGAATTWNVFANCIEEFAYFMPVSGNSWNLSGNDSENAAYLAQCVADAGLTWEDFYIYAGCGGEGDLAYEGMTALIEAMKTDTETFKYCDNFKDGNLYYTQNNGGHTMNAVTKTLYNALPKFFG